MRNERESRLRPEFSEWLVRWRRFFERNYVDVSLSGAPCACNEDHMSVLIVGYAPASLCDPGYQFGYEHCIELEQLNQLTNDMGSLVHGARRLDAEIQMATHPHLYFQPSVGMGRERRNNVSVPDESSQSQSDIQNSQSEQDYFRTTFRRHFPSFWSTTPQEEQVLGEDHFDDFSFMESDDN